MIVVATADFEVYHGVVGELRDRGVEFTTTEPGDDLPERATVAVVGPEDEHPPVRTVRARPDRPREAVEEALSALRGDRGRTVVGIDPGDKPGIAVLSGGTVVAAFQVPVADVSDVVTEELEGAADPVVRIGDGARLRGAAIVDELEDVRVELVDETGTTPYQGAGVRGMGDVLAAVNIARLEGETIESRDIEPTAGEIRLVQERSRERGDDGRSIDETLARRVALGELSMAEALRRHRGG
ncbi:hypothetical protein [Natronomonas sp.]|uniref:hypothetical protein n=1 Tax=Natronomonas sp. TaxID=2184060 RepID=UPI002609883B|nr:hypothetical protein [Natronomonas sp.]